MTAELIARTTVYTGRIFQLEIDVVKLPTGHTIDMEIVRHPGSVVLLPIPEPGKIILVPRMGAANVAERLPPLLHAVQRSRQRVLWVADPMHGNATVTRSGVKTRNFDDILSEIETSIDVHDKVGTYFGGVHFELTGDDVTECLGAGLSEEDLSRNYETLCDPRLNYRQAIQMAFAVGRRLAHARQPTTSPPPARHDGGDG